jgi:hypothetical protein
MNVVFSTDKSGEKLRGGASAAGGASTAGGSPAVGDWRWFPSAAPLASASSFANNGTGFRPN